MSTIDAWLDIVRREAHAVAFHGQTKSTLVCTSYNPKTHAVKGILVPSGVETGWVPIAAIQTNGGAGHFVGPKAGDATKLDGDQFDVEFEYGDPNTLVAKPRMSKPANPPMVMSGEVMTLDENGSSIYFKQDKSVVITHGVKGGTQTWDKDGNHSIDTKGQSLTVHSSGGALSLNSGGGTLNIN